VVERDRSGRDRQGRGQARVRPPEGNPERSGGLYRSGVVGVRGPDRIVDRQPPGPLRKVTGQPGRRRRHRGRREPGRCLRLGLRHPPDGDAGVGAIGVDEDGTACLERAPRPGPGGRPHRRCSTTQEALRRPQQAEATTGGARLVFHRPAKRVPERTAPGRRPGSGLRPSLVSSSRAVWVAQRLGRAAAGRPRGRWGRGARASGSRPQGGSRYCDAQRRFVCFCSGWDPGGV